MSWFKKHKKGLLIAGGILAGASLCAGLGFVGYLFFKKDGLTPSISVFTPHKTTVSSNTSPVVSETAELVASEATEATTKIVDMDPFVRTLPPNWHPSINKVNTAAENGFPNLLKNQTWVGPQQRTYKIKTA